MKRLSWMIVVLVSVPIVGAGQSPELPAADAQATVDKLNLGPTKVYVHWIGKASDYRFFKTNMGYYTAEDFSFRLKT
jgi:hypothetical protein